MRELYSFSLALEVRLPDGDACSGGSFSSRTNCDGCHFPHDNSQSFLQARYNTLREI